VRPSDWLIRVLLHISQFLPVLYFLYFLFLALALAFALAAPLLGKCHMKKPFSSGKKNIFLNDTPLMLVNHSSHLSKKLASTFILP